jgi:hypothetical protein
MADRTPEYWRCKAEAARQAAALMEDPLGKQAMLDIADVCDGLAGNPRLARMTQIWPTPGELLAKDD